MSEFLSVVLSRMKCRRRFALVILLLLGLSGAVFAGGMLAEWRLQRRLGMYRQAGEPTSVSEMDAYMTAGDAGGKNACALVLTASQRYDGMCASFAGERVKPLLPLSAQGHFDPALWTPEIVEKSRAYLAERSELISVLRQASHYSRCYVGGYARFERYAQIRRPLVSVMSRATGFFCLSAMVKFEDGLGDEGVEELQCAWRLNAFLFDEPFLFNTATAMRGELQVLGVIRCLRERGMLTPEQLKRLRQWHPLKKEVLKKGLALERLAGLDFYYAMGAADNPQTPMKYAYLNLFPRMVACSKIEGFLDMIDASLAILDRPWQEQVQAAIDVENRRAHVDAMSRPLLAMTPPITGLVRFYQLYCGAAAQLQQD
jgi:hypothetical protein